MNAVMPAAIAVAGGFLIGSIPFGLIVGRTFYGRDIRAEGSGNIGAANALRTLGKAGAAVVLVLDALKGAIPVIATSLAGQAPSVAALAGAAAVLGHCYSPFLGGRGGKGVATSYGVIWALAWPAAAAFTLVWLAALIALGYASVASMLASVVMPFALWFMLGRTGLAYGLFAAILVVYKHRGNLARLRDGTENTLSFGKKNAAPPDVGVRRSAPQGRRGTH